MSIFSRITEKFRKRKIGEEIRIVGIDDSPFDRSKQRSIIVIGTVYRGGKYLDGLISTYVDIDGSNATDKLIDLINNSKHRAQLQVIMTDGIAFGGFNVLDINKLSNKTKLPVIVIMRKYPDMDAVFKALRNVQGYDFKRKLIEDAGQIYEVDVHKGGKVFVQLAGIVPDEARKIIKISCTNGFIPEPVRVSHIIASGVVEGESRGRA